MISTGATSLNDIVTDLDLSTSAANLNRAEIRARAKKFSGQIGVDDLRGSVAAIMPTMAGSFSISQTGVRHSNGWDAYNPDWNLLASDYSMVSDGDASQGMYVMCQHDWNSGGDVTVQVICHGYIPISNYGKWRVEGVITPNNPTVATYMKWELVGWPSGFYSGSPFYMYSLDNIRTTTDLAQHSQYIEARSNFPYVTSNFHAVVKSEAPSRASMSGTVTGFKFWYGKRLRIFNHSTMLSFHLK